MRSLFSLSPTEAGFRFQFAEVLNWGTFDGQIYRIAPEGQTSLITGGNGSGKTTYIDALLTLIVPEKRMRFYNQSAGTTSRNDRTEESYVLGEYGQTEDESGRLIQRLRERDGNFFSIVLAAFFNQGLQQWVTLAQVRWFNSNELKRCFIIAQSQLTIHDHFQRMDSDGQWKKQLRTQLGSKNTKAQGGLLFFDSPGEYAYELRKHLGMRSEKAQTLFSQTIGLKVLGELNHFVRTHMLEEVPAEEEFQQLRTSYNQLLTAYKTLQKLRKQLLLLTPIENQYQQWNETVTLLKQTEEYLIYVPVYAALQRQDILHREIQQAQAVLTYKASQIQDLSHKREDIEQQIYELEASIRSDETGQHLKTLNKQISEQERLKGRCQSQLNKYNRLAESIGLTPNPDEEAFKANQNQLSILAVDIVNQLKIEDEERIQKRIEREKHQKLLADQVLELNELRQRRNNISGDEARIRAQLITHLGTTEQEIPFVGELLRVKETERRWEMPIEKVLHNFALHLLVPDTLYAQVNAWVNATQLKGRIRYFRIRDKKQPITPAFQADTLPGKLDIHPKTAYEPWLRTQLKERFDYLCSDDLELFQQASQAVTSQGLIRNREKHQKDDRSHTFQPSNYVLGWENSEKIKHLELELTKTQKTLAVLDKEITQLEKQEKKLKKQQQDSQRLQEEDFTRFSDLNWQAVALEIERLQQEKHLLEQANDHIRALENQLKQMKEQSKNIESEWLKANREEETLKQQQEVQKSTLSTTQMELKPYTPQQLEDLQDVLVKALGLTTSDTLPTLEKYIQKIKGQLISQKEKLEAQRHEQINKIQASMRTYKHPSTELLQQFPDWRADTHLLGEDINYVNDYLEIATRIRAQELLEQEKRFQTYFNQSIYERMTAFEQFMERQQENIEDNIRALNQALKEIHFRSNPQTYIQIKIIPVRKGRSADFRHQLKAWKPIAAQSGEPQVLEESFAKIQALIQDLENRPDWRKEVIDVRNWMEFSAQEISSTNDTLVRTYATTGKLSGGEKAQLTYTILTAAIAYQFNISQAGDEVKSFRFICVDESFSNQDDEKAAYLMDLCKQLHLQLLVVTPNEKTHVVEPYISRIHLVLRRNNRDSVLYDMPIEDFQRDREMFVQT